MNGLTAHIVLGVKDQARQENKKKRASHSVFDDIFEHER